MGLSKLFSGPFTPFMDPQCRGGDFRSRWITIHSIVESSQQIGIRAFPDPLRRTSLMRFIFAFLAVLLLSSPGMAQTSSLRPYSHRWKPIANPRPLLADHPKIVAPITETARFEAPRLIDEPGAVLDVRAWRFSYNARGIIEIPNRLRADRTALIVVHPWGIDDGQGWKTPVPAGAAFYCTREKNELVRRHVTKVINPFIQKLRSHMALVAYSLPEREDPIRKSIYRSIRNQPTKKSRESGMKELRAKLKRFEYQGRRLPESVSVSNEKPVADYFRQVPSLDAGARYNNHGFWKLPIPVMKDIDVALRDLVIYDADGYEPLRKFLKAQGIRHILLAGFATDMCVCSTTAGYENLRKDFNVFLVGDATVATFPANPTPAYATNAALSMASMKVLVTQISWIRPLTK